MCGRDPGLRVPAVEEGAVVGPRALLLVDMWAGRGLLSSPFVVGFLLAREGCSHTCPGHDSCRRSTCWCIAPEGRRSRVDVEPSFRWRAFLIRPLRAPRVPAQCTRDPVCAASAGRYGHRSPPSCLAPPDTRPEAVAHPACCALTQNKHALGGFAFRPISLVCGRGGVPPILPWRHAGPTKGDAVHPAHRVTKGGL